MRVLRSARPAGAVSGRPVRTAIPRVGSAAVARAAGAGSGQAAAGYHTAAAAVGATTAAQHRRALRVLARAAVAPPQTKAAKGGPAEPTIPRGATAGAALVVENVTLQAGDVDIMTDVSATVMPGQRVGLVGANGCGKSTLLKCLSGHRQADAGRIAMSHAMEVGYLEQTAVSGSTRTVAEEARSRMTDLIAAEAALERAAQLAAEGHERGADMLQKAQDAVRCGCAAF